MNIHVTLTGSINYDLQNNVFLMYSIPSYMKQLTFNSDIFSFSVGMTYPKTCFNEKVEESREKVFLLS